MTFFNRWKYNLYWLRHGKRWSYGNRIIDTAIQAFTPNSVLDAGCGRGDTVEILRQRGIHAVGVDIANIALPNKPYFHACSITQLPFSDQSFDLVFSSEVLEHIPEREIPRVVGELVRVSQRFLFLTISLRPSSNNNAYHVTLKPRTWWENHFTALGCQIRDDIVSRIQKRDPALSNYEVLMRGPTRAIIAELDNFIKNEPYSLHGEIEPWYFVFEK